MPPKYHGSNILRVFDGPPTTLPAAYGSEYDAQYERITQLHDNTVDTSVVSDELIDETIDSVIPVGLVSELKPSYDIFQYTAPVSVDSSVALPFKAKSIRIDNLTNQWVFIRSLRLWVPPDWYGAVFSCNGIQQVSITFMPPPGLTDAVVTPNTVVSIVAHFDRVPDVAGIRRL